MGVLRKTKPNLLGTATVEHSDAIRASDSNSHTPGSKPLPEVTPKKFPI